MSPEARVAIARARATMEPRPTVRPLSNLPIPNIAPTTFSARWNDRRQESQEDSQAIPAYMPSSPPLSDDGDVEIVEPVNHGILEPRTPVHLSSPGSVQYGRKTHGERDLAHGQFRPGGLTSSVIKGEAANSLLQLVRGGIASYGGGVGMCGL